MSNLTQRPILQKPEPDQLVVQGHPRGCKCPSCVGRRNRRKGAEKQRQARKALGIQPRFHAEGSNEERWSESPHLPGMRFEVKSGGQISKWLIAAIAQVEASRSFVGTMFRPAVVLAPPGTSKQYVVIEMNDLLDLATAWQETGRGSEIKQLARQARKTMEQIEGLV